MPMTLNPANGKIYNTGLDYVVMSRAPTSADNQYPAPFGWLDTAGDAWYTLVDVDESGSATWSAGGGGGSSTLEDLTDVTITSASKGDGLFYNGTVWVNVAVGSNDQVLTADSAEAAGVKWATSGGGGGTDDGQVIDLINAYGDF